MDIAQTTSDVPEQVGYFDTMITASKIECITTCYIDDNCGQAILYEYDDNSKLGMCLLQQKQGPKTIHKQELFNPDDKNIVS